MYVQNVPVCTGTTRKRVSTHQKRGGRGRGRRQPRFSSVKQVFLTFWSILTGCWVHLLSPIFCLPKFAHTWVITCFRGSPKKRLDLAHIENGASSIIERSALARYNVLIIRNRNTLQTICSATFAPFLSCSYFFFLFFYDDAMRWTTTQGQRPPRQRHVDNTTPHPTTRHHTTKKTKTHTYTHMYMFIYVYMYMSVPFFAHFSRKKAVWNTCLP